MKKISVVAPVVLNTGADSRTFKPGVVYEVDNAVAAHPYLSRFVASIAEIGKPKKGAKKPSAKEADDKPPAKEADDGTSDA